MGNHIIDWKPHYRGSFTKPEFIEDGELVAQERFGTSIISIGNLRYLIHELETILFYVASATVPPRRRPWHYVRFVP